MNDLIRIESKDGQMVVSSREVAVNFEKDHSAVLKKIHGYYRGDWHTNGLIDEFDSSVNTLQYFIPSEYQDTSGKINKEYLLTRDGFSLLVMGFTGGKALSWKLKYIEAFNMMEQQLSGGLPNELSPQLQVLINLELSQRQMQQAIDFTNKRIDNIGEIIALDTTSWRTDTKAIVVKIAQSLGGNQYIVDIHKEAYNLLNSRMGVDLATRLTNKRRRMADDGVCKSTRDKVSKLDIIADDKKLIEGYVAIIKEMAIKYGVVDRVQEGA